MNVIDHLRAIRDEFGDLTPELVVEAARDPEHPLHSRFEWDDSIAGQKWRLEQASQLLRVTYRPDPSKPTDLRAFWALRGEDSPRASYTPTEEVAADEFNSALMLRQMEREWKSFKRRYGEMHGFVEMVQRSLQQSAS